MLYYYKALVTRVIDGDTFVCDIDLGFNLWHKDVRVRLLGYSAPESKGLEKKFGTIAKAKLSEYISKKEIRIHTEKTDDFGRYLGQIWIDENDNDVATILIEEGYGYVWDGKTPREAFELDAAYPMSVKHS